ncbi:hypothetical protein Ahy_A02g008923 [Arachis hypogaea]|uniref:Mutator sub-class protein n=1 Tax=Arachis hypogaea TaxID=3818 RepID=A0A445EG63_ARAHY|nr:hypothetical protein Ahy_A02g008923 [Arachis hypogaea]
MAGEDSFIVLVYHKGSIKRKTRSGVKFTDKDPLCIIVSSTTSYDDLASSVLQKLGLEGVKRVKKFFYRIPVTVLQDTVKYDCFTIGSDEDLQVMFLCRRQFFEVRTPELLAKLVDVVSSSGGSNRNTNTVATVAGSSSSPAFASSSVPAYEPPVPPVASPSFAIDLNGSVGDEVGTAELVPTSVYYAAPAVAEDELFDDVEDDDVESDMIADDIILSMKNLSGINTIAKEYAWIEILSEIRMVNSRASPTKWSHQFTLGACEMEGQPQALQFRSCHQGDEAPHGWRKRNGGMSSPPAANFGE